MSLGFNLGQTGNASEVGAGIVKLATQAQIDAKQADDGGIPLVVTPDKIPSPNRVTGFLAGENIAAGDAVALQTYDEFQNVIVVDYRSTSTSYLVDEPTPRAQALPLPNDGRTHYDFFQVRITGSFTPSWTVSIRQTLTGADLASTSGSGNGITITVDVSAIVFVPGTTYYVIFTETGGGADSQWYGQALVSGGAYLWNGSTFVAQDIRHDVALYYLEQTKFAWEVKKASAAVLLNQNINFVGFAAEAALDGEEVIIDNEPIIKGAGFTPGSHYYLSDTPGQISTTPGTITRDIGRAISATEIVRRRGSVSPVMQPGNSFTSPCHMTYSMNSANTGTINGVSYGSYGGPMLRPGDAMSNAGGPRIRIFDTGSIL